MLNCSIMYFSLSLSLYIYIHIYICYILNIGAGAGAGRGLEPREPRERRPGLRGRRLAEAQGPTLQDLIQLEEGPPSLGRWRSLRPRTWSVCLLDCM